MTFFTDTAVSRLPIAPGRRPPKKQRSLKRSFAIYIVTCARVG